MVFVGQNEDACFCAMIALETDLGPILVRFWIPKSFQNRSQEGPEGCWKSWSFLHAFGNFQKSIFWSNMARFCSPRWLQIGPKIGSKSLPEPTSLRILILNRVWTNFGSILNRSWTDFGPILNPKSFQNRSQEGPRRCWKSWSILNAFRILQESNFWPTWPQHDPILSPKTAPSWSQN